MGIAVRKQSTADRPAATGGENLGASRSLAALGGLAGADIETRFVGDLGRDLRQLFDPITDAALPIYFGPLLGRLYLEGL